jgi:hypothetical protein
MHHFLHRFLHKNEYWIEKLVEFHLIHKAKQGYKVHESNQIYTMVERFQSAKVMYLNISFEGKDEEEKKNLIEKSKMIKQTLE